MNADTNRGGHGVLFQSFFGSLKLPRKRGTRKYYPKVYKCSEKVVSENILLEWENGS